MTSNEKTLKTLTDNEIEVIDNENNNTNNTTISDVTHSQSLDDNDCHRDLNEDTDQMLTTNQTPNKWSLNENKSSKRVPNEKCKTQIYVSKSSKASFIDSGMALKRSASADSIFIPTSYVSSPQLSLHTYCGRLMMDRATQTPEEWEELDKRKIERKINDHFDIIKSVKTKQTQRNSQRGSKSLSNTDETNNLLSSTSSPSSSINVSPQHNIPKQELSTNAAAVSTTTMPKSGPIAIPNKLALELSSNYRSGNSVEELNQEIESLVLKGISDNNKMGDRIPEGHRAPVIELLWPRRTVKTQTFNSDIDYDHDNDSNDSIVGYHNTGDSLTSEESCPSSDISRSESPVSPAETETVANNDSNHVDYSSSPKINKFLTREPPDGCEKVKIVSEDERANSNHSHRVVAPRPLKPSSGFLLLPSRGSAFLPIPKSNYLNSNTVSALDNLKNEINKYK